MTSVSAYLRQNVLGLVAIFLALSGGAYAVTTKTVFNQDLGNSSVDSRVLANGAVTGPKIHSASVGPKKLKLEDLVDTLQTRVQTNCPGGQAMQGILSNGTPICSADAVNAGTITGVTTSGGLTGGGTSGTVDIGIDPTVVQNRVADSCPAGQTIRSVAQDGTVTCQAIAPGTVTSVGSGFGLTGGPITGAGSLAVNPAAVQSRVTGTCTGNTAIASISQGGGATCSPNFDVTEHSGRVTVAPSANTTLLAFGDLVLRASCTAGGNAVVEIGDSSANGADFLDYQTRSTSSGMIGATVAGGAFATIMNTATNDLGQFNVITNKFQQIDGSFYGWSSTQAGAGGSCQFDASALTY